MTVDTLAVETPSDLADTPDLMNPSAAMPDTTAETTPETAEATSAPVEAPKPKKAPAKKAVGKKA